MEETCSIWGLVFGGVDYFQGLGQDVVLVGTVPGVWRRCVCRRSFGLERCLGKQEKQEEMKSYGNL